MVLLSDQARMYFAIVAKSIRAEAVAIPGLPAALQRFVVQAHVPSKSGALHLILSDLRPHFLSTVLPS